MIWKEKEGSRIMVVQMDNLRGLLGIRGMDRFTNAWIGELCVVTKGIYKRIDESVLWWFGHLEIMEKDMFPMRVYVGECAGSRSVGKPRKRWIVTVKDCLRKKRFGCQASKENGAG